MTETTFWHHTVRPALAPFGPMVRIENRVQEGTPDVAYCLRRSLSLPAVSGWIELKHAYHWPARGLLKFRHLTMAQIAWLSRWESAGGRACVLMQVNRDYFLLAPKMGRELALVGATRDRLIQGAAVHGEKVFPTGKIIQWLTT